MKRRQAGFSIIEMMVAMTVTLLIMGAVYKLVTAGQSSFRREPALADRQANIRAAMDTITRDLLDAGFQMPRYVKIYTQNLDGSKITDSPMGASGQKTDELEFYRANPNCPAVAVCDVNGSEMTFRSQIPECIIPGGAEMPVLFMSENEIQVVTVKNPGKGGGNNACKSGDKGKNGHLNNPGEKMCPCATGGQNCEPTQDECDEMDAESRPYFCPKCPTFAMSGEIIRYRVRNDAKGVPNLERSNTGNLGPWTVVARGVEDLQIQYRRGRDASWSNDPEPPPKTAAVANDLIARVRVELWARVVDEQNLAGQRVAAGLPNAPRGRLVSEIAPRVAQSEIAQANSEF